MVFLQKIRDVSTHARKVGNTPYVGVPHSRPRYIRDIWTISKLDRILERQAKTIILAAGDFLLDRKAPRCVAKRWRHERTARWRMECCLLSGAGCKITTFRPKDPFHDQTDHELALGFLGHYSRAPTHFGGILPFGQNSEEVFQPAPGG